MAEFAKNQGIYIPVVEWIEQNMYDWSKVTVYGGEYDYTNAPKLELLQYQKDILNHVTERFQCLCYDEPSDVPTPYHAEPGEEDTRCQNCKDNIVGTFYYNTIIWSQPKKHGKTQIAAAFAAWYGCIVEAPNVVLTMASNQEQSAGLIFNSLTPSIYALGGKVPPSAHATPEIRLPNGTVIKAIPNNYAGQAGGNYGLTSWSELWTLKSERDYRLWDETPPVPTRKNSIRWVETYAGFENESDILQGEFNRIFKNMSDNETQPNARPVPGLEHIVTRRNGETIPSCWHIPEESFFMFWDNEIRAPWITERYIASQKASTRHATFTRLWKNLWQSSIGTFIEPEQWEMCLTEDSEEWGPMVLAGDASQRNDTTALVGVQKRMVKVFGKVEERFRVMRVRVFDPKKSVVSPELRALGAKKHDLDLTATIAAEVKRIYESGLMDGPFYYDPAQMHDVAMQLRKQRVPCVEFPQGKDRLDADSHLWTVINSGRLDAYPGILGDHVKAANAKEYENEQVRIIKGTATQNNKVDAAVALSMAVYRASQRIQIDRKKKKSSSRNMLTA